MEGNEDGTGTGRGFVGNLGCLISLSATAAAATRRLQFVLVGNERKVTRCTDQLAGTALAVPRLRLFTPMFSSKSASGLPVPRLAERARTPSAGKIRGSSSSSVTRSI
jgi:hypothetical protein